MSHHLHFLVMPNLWLLPKQKTRMKTSLSNWMECIGLLWNFMQIITFFSLKSKWKHPTGKICFTLKKMTLYIGHWNHGDSFLHYLLPSETHSQHWVSLWLMNIILCYIHEGWWMVLHKSWVSQNFTFEYFEVSVSSLN